MKRYYCTYFDRNYLVKAIALIESLNKHEKNEFQLFVVCLDEITRLILEKINLPNVITIPLHEIEQGDASLIATKQDRSLAEYYWTMTPTIILRILERNPEITVLTYLDADLLLFSSPDPIFEELGYNAVLIHEHRFSPSLAYLEVNGKYNVGLLSFRRNANGLKALNWWRERCIEWCYLRLEDGKMGDQLYLNDWPTRFKDVVVLQNIGAGLAPWNHEQYDYSMDKDGRILVDGMPVIFYHFQSFAFVNPEVIIPATHTHYPLTVKILHTLFLPYIYALSQAIVTVQSVLPDFSFGLVNQDILTSNHTFLAKRELSASIRELEVSRFPNKITDDWDCYSSYQLKDLPNRESLEGDKRTEVPVQTRFQAILSFGNLYSSKGDYKEAEKRFREALSIEGVSGSSKVVAHYNLGSMYEKKGDCEKAKEKFEEVLAMMKDINSLERKKLSGKAHFHLGCIYKSLGERRKAIREFENCLKLVPDHRKAKKFSNYSGG